MSAEAETWTQEQIVEAYYQHRVIPPEVVATLSEDDRTRIRRAAWALGWSTRVDAIGIPTRLRAAEFGQGRVTPAMQRAGVYVRDDVEAGRCLVLTGPTGIGKSWAAVAALRALGHRHQHFWYFPALCGSLLNPETRSAALDDAKTIPLVAFDDFGVEYVKEGGLIDCFLDEIIWFRESEFKPTIITTNLTTDALKNRLPSRLIDRLRGDWGRIFECPGESLR